MGLQLLSFALSPDLGIRVITPLLIAAKALPVPSIAVKACNKMGAISSAHSWKNSMGRPSFPGVLPLGKSFDCCENLAQCELPGQGLVDFSRNLDRDTGPAALLCLLRAWSICVRGVQPRVEFCYVLSEVVLSGDNASLDF